MAASRTIGIILAVGVGYLVLKGMANAPATSTSQSASVAAPAYPDSLISYAQADSEVGCKSTYSDQKKDDIFDANYKDHWFIWKGKIETLDSGTVSLNVDGVGIQDVQVDFADKNAGYNLSKGAQLKVRFLMKSAGGCFLSFGGKDATIVR